jgi:asparagine synthase (glutamine-hydrolysing)
MTVNDVVAATRANLVGVVGAYRPQCVLFSGGLDSSIAAALSPCRKGILVTFGPEGPDLRYAREAAGAIGLTLIHKTVSVDEALAAIPEVIATLRSFDPAIPNDLAVWFALKEAKALGISSVMTGDGADELFGGYSYMAEVGDLDGYIRHLSGTMSFNSTILGERLGVEVIQPFLDKEILDFALQIQGKWKIREEKGVVHGKWVLRRACEGLLPPGILWQGKRPLETGSGMTRLNAMLDAVISDEEFADKKRSSGIRFYNKAHLHYYEVFRKTVGDIPPPGPDERACEGCGAGMKEGRGHCRVCGWVKEAVW